MSPRVAFLFLGETLLIPHLWPIAEALAGMEPALPIDLWISTATHEALLAPWSARWPSMRLRRVPGFRDGPADGVNPSLPFKPAMLARLAPRLLGTRVAVCAEQTSLWLPRLLPWLPTRFVKTAHGAGSLSARSDPRRRAAWRTLVPSASERDGLVAHGVDPARLFVTGYVKSAFRHRTPAAALFPADRPTLLYTPHWQRHRSSWWAWGRQVVEMLVGQQNWNVILAPHQRLLETEPGVRTVLGDVASLPHVHVDLGSFAGVDGSYTAAADLYLGDTSSQVVEFLQRPRPCIFLNPDGWDWRARGDHGFWDCGEVVERVERIPDALAAGAGKHPFFVSQQQRLVAAQLGEVGPATATRAAALVIDALA
jgi:hypothetical protein